MEGLDLCLMGEIMQYLDLKDLFLGFSLVCREFCQLAQDNYYLSRYVSSYLKIQKGIRQSAEQAQKVIKHVVTSQPKKLDFHGFGTTGGVDEDRGEYWVENLFVEGELGYCSRDNKDNLNCVGVLRSILPDTLTEEQKRDRQEVAEVVRSADALRGIIRNRIGLPGSPLNRMEEDFFKYVWTHASFLFFQESSSEESIRQRADYLNRLYQSLVEQEIKITDLRKDPKDLYTLIEPLDFQLIQQTPKTSVAKELVFSRKGNFTCPVKTFMMFISEDYLDPNSEELKVYDNLKSSEDIDALMTNDSKLPQALPLVRDSHKEYRLFKWTPKPLKPLVWGKFISREGETLQVALKQIFSGKYLYVKLIDPENRMQEMNDMHEFTNIDSSYAGLIGYEIDLN